MAARKPEPTATSSRATTARRALRDRLASPTISVLCGAHDPLSARLIEECGFDGIWASSYGVSLARYCLPDADLVTMTETADALRDMATVATLPVLADCNAGFGNAVNVMRLIGHCETAGVAGVCIEDNPFPKRCSLYEGWDRELEPVDSMVGKIRAAKAAQQDPDFVVVARVEAIIAGLGVAEALRRADAYAEAGADALLIHAREFHLLEDFTSAWSGDLPLIAVPTLFPGVHLRDLEACGFSVAIFANQAVRAAIKAMRSTLLSLRRLGTGAAVEGDIVSLDEVLELVGVDGLREAERSFLGASQPTVATTA